MGGTSQGSGIGGLVACRYPNNKKTASTTGSPTFSDTGGYKYFYYNGGGSIVF
jgi:hypothetical protein